MKACSRNRFRRPISFIGVVLLLALFSSPGSATLLQVDAFKKGHISRTCTSFPSCRSLQAAHNAADSTTPVTQIPIAGDRSYYLFDLTGVVGNVLSAIFQVEGTSINFAGTVGVFDVGVVLGFFNTSGTEIFGAFDQNKGPIQLVYEDIGSGGQYASFSASSTGLFSESLNVSGLADVNAAVGNYIGLGLSATSNFGGTFGPGSLILELEEDPSPAPVPAPPILFLFAVALLALRARR